MISKLQIAIILLLCISLHACSTQSDSPRERYEKRVNQGLSSGERSDSLFLGYHFGMSEQAFFDHSWKLNNQKKVINGHRSASIRYDLDYLNHRAHKTFYPEFHEGKIYKMPVRYEYNGWAPWNRDLWSDSLKKDILRVFEKRYNQAFVEMNHPERGVPAHIFIANNKRIAIFKAGDREVAVNYVDLSVLNKIREK